MIANANRGKNTKAFKPSDFMPKYEANTAEDNSKRLLSKVEMLNAAFGGADLRAG